jgi:hypothetical protein
MLRDKARGGESGDGSALALRQRPVNLEKIEKHSRRAFPRYLRPELLTKLAQDPRKEALDQSLPQSLPVFQNWRLPEKVLHGVDALVKSSFESGRWCFNGNDLIINSSPSQVSEVQSLHDFLGDIDSGCNAADTQDFFSAGFYWKRAFVGLEALIQGQYYDIIPNLIQKINDLNRQGRSELADSLKKHAANCGKKFLAPNDSNLSIYNDLGSLEMALVVDIEERIMRRFSELFELYLGPLCYNSFVMMIDAARRRLLQYPWTTFEDCLPAIAYLDATFGPTDRRCLDVIGMRVEISSQRGKFEDTENEALLLVQRAEMIQNDDWRRFYHLTRGWYFRGCAQYALGKRDAATESLQGALRYEQELCKVDDFHIFNAERVIILKYLEDLADAGRAV